jgi:hypothetical protein
LKTLDIRDAPTIKSVGSEFQASSSSSMVAFLNLTTLNLEGLCEWEQWDWEDMTAHVTTMPSVEGLGTDNCKLSCLPPRLANNRRRALRRLNMYETSNLTALENFPSLVKLEMFDCPELRRISGHSRLHKIIRCPKLEVLDGVPALDSLELEDGTMEAPPGYLSCVDPRFLKLTCSMELYKSIISGSSSECDKIRHIAKHEINYIEDSDAALHEYSAEGCLGRGPVCVWLLQLHRLRRHQEHHRAYRCQEHRCPRFLRTHRCQEPRLPEATDDSSTQRCRCISTPPRRTAMP